MQILTREILNYITPEGRTLSANGWSNYETKKHKQTSKDGLRVCGKETSETFEDWIETCTNWESTMDQDIEYILVCLHLVLLFCFAQAEKEHNNGISQELKTIGTN